MERSREILSCIGRSILDYVHSLRKDDEKRVLLVSPRAKGIRNAVSLFPSAKIVLIVRDGRDVCESSERSFGRSGRWWKREWVRRWNEGAESILDFLSTFQERRGVSWERLRYENLLRDPRGKFSKVLRMLRVPSEDYPWEDAERSPVIGSSDTADSEEGLNWRPKQKDSDFSPLGRWQGNWGYLRRRSFKRIAGNSMKELGYEC